MRILIDASCLMKELTGVGTYLFNVLEQISKLDLTDDYYIFMNAMKSKTPDLFPNQAKFHLCRRHLPGKLLLEMWRNWKWPSIELLAGRHKMDVFHSPNYLYQASKSSRIVATIHDLAFLKTAGYGSRYAGRYHRETLPKTISRASKIITCSVHVKKDIVDLLKIDESRVKVIYYAVNTAFYPAEDRVAVTTELRQAGIPERFILSTGTLEPRKNYPLLLNAFDRMAQKHDEVCLIIAGKSAEAMDQIQQTMDRMKYKSRVHLLGYTPMHRLIQLYQAAELSVFPAWDEGFGFGPLEAAACGSAVIASRIPVHMEIMKNQASYVDTQDSDDLAVMMDHLITHNEIRDAMRTSGPQYARQYDWKKAALQHLEVYQEAGTE